MARSIGLSPFEEVVREALELSRDVDKLGHESLLAAPYLLASYLDKNDISAGDRGGKLLTLIGQAIDKITGENSARYKTILRKQYLEGRRIESVQQDSNVVLAINSKAAYHESRKAAIRQLSFILTEMLAPALRLEQPPQTNRKLFSREWEAQSCWQMLQDGKTVALTGNGGVGKTSLGSHLAQRWGRSNVFWFTIQPGSNDHIQSIAFGLGYFFKLQYEPTLWQEMLTQRTGLKADVLAHITRDSLQKFNSLGNKLLFCFDEVDRLDSAVKAHSEVINFLNALSREEVPLLLIGQQRSLELQHSFNLEDLTLPVTSQVLRDVNLRLSPTEVQKIHSYTYGNPRLIDLVITLLEYGTPIDELQNELDTSLPLQFFLNKIFLRLDTDEADLLRTLSVFRSFAPGDLWQKQENLNKALTALIAKHLITVDDHGGVAILPAYREIIYGMLPSEIRQSLHEFAVMVWTERAAYTAAAYHLIQSGRSKDAVLQWREHQQQEISQGQAYLAYEIFHDLNTSNLSQQVREQHALLCVDIARLIGNDRQALADIDSVTWNTPILSIKAYIEKGKIYNDHDQFVQARDNFTSALERANDTISIQLADIYKGRSWSYYREGELQKAWLESQRAQYEVAHVQGTIQYNLMKWEQAEHLFHIAFFVAQEIGDQDKIANAANNLLNLYSTLGRHEEVEEYASIAIERYKAIGQYLGISRIKTNVAMSHNFAGKYEQALHLLHEAREIVKSHPFELPAQYERYIDLEFAEAYLGKEEWDNAEKSIQRLSGSAEVESNADVYRIMGEICGGRGEWATAIQWLDRAMEIIERDDPPDSYFYARTYRSRSKVYAKAGEFHTAMDDKQRAIDLFTEINLPHEVENTESELSTYF